MKDQPKFRDDKLAVTGEVGSEGGSFADPTFQEAAKLRLLGTGLPRYACAECEPGTDTGPDPDQGMKKYPTE